MDDRVSPPMQKAVEQGLVTPTPEDEREQNRRDHLRRHPPSDDLYVFGFGSLMWNPAFEVAGSHPALVRGWHRRFSLWLAIGRGTPDFPGLSLGLEPGGSVRGIALRIAAERIDSETRLLWRREMFAGAYRPIWVMADLGDRVVSATSFAINRAYERYGHAIPLDVQARHIALAEGPLGPCIDYLENTVRILDAIGQTSGTMHTLLDAALQIRSAPRPDAQATVSGHVFPPRQCCS
ncbi:MAG: gamma-glutamylcyclotransferase [bacterium]|nr:gamma-glutamylcyclotransferase [bacterium]